MMMPVAVFRVEPHWSRHDVWTTTSILTICGATKTLQGKSYENHRDLMNDFSQTKARWDASMNTAYKLTLNESKVAI